MKFVSNVPLNRHSHVLSFDAGTRFGVPSITVIMAMAGTLKRYTYAAQPRMPSSSVASSAVYVSDRIASLGGLMAGMKRPKYERLYNLKDLISLPVVCNSDSACRLNTRSGCPVCSISNFFRAVLGRHPEIDIVEKKEVKTFKDIPVLFNSTSVKPDLALYAGKNGILFPVMFAEEHLVSNNNPETSYIHTAQKTLLVVLDQLRLLRNYSLPQGTDITEIKGFCFPCQNEVSAVTEVVVKFEFFRFRVTYKVLQKEEVSDAIRSAFSESFGHINGLNFSQQRTVHENIGVPLSPDVLTDIFPGAKQLQSKSSYLLRDTTYYYKFLFSALETNSVRSLVDVVNNEFDAVDVDCLPFLIYSKVVLRKFKSHDSILFFQFPALVSPLSPFQARQCLYPLVEGVVNALKKLHDLRFGHLDIRLDNICFKKREYQELYKVILIDLDRCLRFEEDVAKYTGSSTMYDQELAVNENDWRQLCIMITWIFEYERLQVNYHSITLEHSRDLKTDNFMRCLWEGKFVKTEFEGNFKSKLTEKNCCTPLEEVLNERRL